MLKIAKPTLQGVSKETHPEVFRGIEAIASEFPDGWYVHLIAGDDTDLLEIKLTGHSHLRLVAERQTSEDVQKGLRDLRKLLTGP